MMSMRRSKRKRRDGGNTLALVGIMLVVGSLAVAINVRAAGLQTKNHEYQVRQEILSRQVEQEEERAKQLEEKRIFVQTKQYIEQVAKEKLGLVNPDEILLKPEE